MKLNVERQGCNDIWVVHDGKSNNYWYVTRVGGFQYNVTSVYIRGEGWLKKTCYRILDKGATREKVIAAIVATA